MNNKKSKTLSEYPDVISPEEIKEILRISTSGVYHLLQAGTIKSIRVGKRYIIPKQSIIDFLSWTKRLLIRSLLLLLFLSYNDHRKE